MSHIDRLSEQFQKFTEGDTLSHSYLFFGEDHEALTLFAKKLASYLETNVFEVSARPLSDAYFLSPNSQGSIGIDEVRGVKSFLMSRPAIGRRRTVVISHAETLTPEAQNALLKVAEEPPAKALLILLSRSVEGFLPTVASRFQKVSFSREVTSGVQSRPVSSSAPLAKEFLKATSDRRSVLIKSLLLDAEETPTMISAFLDGLIGELHKDLPRSFRSLGFVLRRKKLMEEVNTNPRLQLEAISKML